MVGVDVVIGTALLETVAIETDHASTAFANITVHLLSVFVVWTGSIAGIVVRIVPHITWAS